MHQRFSYLNRSRDDYKIVGADLDASELHGRGAEQPRKNLFCFEPAVFNQKTNAC